MIGTRVLAPNAGKIAWAPKADLVGLWVALLVAFLVGLGSAPALGDDLAEAERLVAASLEAFERSDHAAALLAIDRAEATLVRAHGDADHPDVIGCHGIAARIHLAADDRAAALDRLDRAADAVQRRVGLALADDERVPTLDQAQLLLAAILVADLAEELDRRDDAADLLLRMERCRRAFDYPIDETIAEALAGAVRLLRALARPCEAVEPLASLRSHYRAKQDAPNARRREVATLETLVIVQRDCGDLAGKLEAHQELIDLERRDRIFDSPALAARLLDLGDALMRAERYGDALAAYTDAMTMRTALAMHEGRRTDSWALAEMINNVGAALVSLGRPAEALPFHEDALAMRRRLARDQPNHLVGASLDNLASCLNRLGRVREALALGEEAVAMVETIVGGADDASLALVMSNLAAAQYAAGRLPVALSLMEEATAMRLRLDGAVPSVDGVRAVTNLALALHLAGRTAEAAARIDQAIGLLDALHAAGGRPLLEERANALQVSSAIAAALGRPQRALEALREAIDLSRSLHDGAEHPDTAGLLIDLAAAVGATGDHEAAIGLGEEAAGVLERTLGDSHPDHATALMTIASHELLAGDPAAARRRLDRALAALLEHFNDEHPLVIECLNRLQVTALTTGDFEQAVAFGRRGAEGALGKGGLGAVPNAARSFANFGWTLVDLDRLDEAERWLRRAVDLEETQLDTMGGTELERFAAAATTRSYGAGAGLAWIAALRGEPAEAIGHLERSRSVALRSMLERGRRAADGGLLGPVIDLAHERGDTMLRDEAMALSVALDAVLVDNLDDPNDHDGRRSAFRRRALQMLDAHLPVRLEPASIAQMQDVLERDELILIYLISSHAGLVFAIGHPEGPLARSGTDGLEQHPLIWPEGTLVTAEGLRTAIDRHLSGLMIEGRLRRGIGRERPVGNRVGPAGSHRLFQGLIPAELWDVIREARVVHIVPDDSMHRLPLETLPVAPPGAAAADSDPALRRQWLDVGPMVTYAPSATVMVDRIAARQRQRESRATPIVQANARPTARPTVELLAVGDPIFTRDGIGDPALRPLPGTRVEIAAIIQAIEPELADAIATASDEPIVGTRTVALLGESATRDVLAATLLARTTRPRHLHIATHGLVESGERALMSRLALTAAPADGAHDRDAVNALTLHELIEQWAGVLDATELVVLSACDSVGGDSAGQNLRQSEGVFGLPWGFMYAGAPTVIASLWEVDDESTAILMGALYRELSRLDQDEPHRILRAFTAARRSLRESHPEPYHWGPFILIGAGE